MILEPPTVEREPSKKKHTGSNHLRVLVADDHERVLQRTASLLEPHFEVVGTATNGKMLVKEALRLQPDVIVSDVLMPGLNGIDAARELRKLGCKAAIVFLSVYEAADFVNACVSEGALGYVTKARMGVDLVHAIQEASQNRQFISPSVSQ
jgi:DNA-binding NarL/FixJ family response regulator